MIVFLIVTAAMFSLYFITKPGQEQIAISSRESTLANNFLTTMLATSTNCHNRQIKDLLSDCLKNIETKLPCPGGDSCTYLEGSGIGDGVIDQLLKATLDEFNRKYYLELLNPDTHVNITRGSPCRKGEAATQLTPMVVGYNAELTLILCSD